jgi:hypothetical protein
VVTPFRQKLAIPLLPLFRKSRPSNVTRDGDHLVVFNAVSSPPARESCGDLAGVYTLLN